MGKTKKLRLNRFDCVACGTSIGVDEDACCASCGRQTVIVKRGVPDYSLVLAGMEAEEDLASRASPSAPSVPREVGEALREIHSLTAPHMGTYRSPPLARINDLADHALRLLGGADGAANEKETAP